MLRNMCITFGSFYCGRGGPITYQIKSEDETNEKNVGQHKKYISWNWMIFLIIIFLFFPKNHFFSDSFLTFETMKKTFDQRKIFFFTFLFHLPDLKIIFSLMRPQIFFLMSMWVSMQFKSGNQSNLTAQSLVLIPCNAINPIGRCSTGLPLFQNTVSWQWLWHLKRKLGIDLI